MDDKQLENDFIEAIKSSAPSKESLNAFEEMLASGKLIIVSWILPASPASAGVVGRRQLPIQLQEKEGENEHNYKDQTANR